MATGSGCRRSAKADPRRFGPGAAQLVGRRQDLVDVQRLVQDSVETFAIVLAFQQPQHIADDRDEMRARPRSRIFEILGHHFEPGHFRQVEIKQRYVVALRPDRVERLFSVFDDVNAETALRQDQLQQDLDR